MLIGLLGYTCLWAAVQHVVPDPPLLTTPQHLLISYAESKNWGTCLLPKVFRDGELRFFLLS